MAFAAMSLIVGALYATNADRYQSGPSGAIAPDRYASTAEVRTKYIKSGELLFQAFPGGEGPFAGDRDGIMIHFSQPFDNYKGKTVSIEAYHPQSGSHTTITPPSVISEPSPGYRSLDRFTTTFILPLSGIWAFEIKLNDKFYGDFVLEAKDPAPWSATQPFKMGQYVMAGEKDKAGFIVGPYQGEDGILVDQQPIIAGKKNKYMWHFWGSKEELAGPLRVMAVREGTNKEVEFLRFEDLGGKLNKADAHIPSSMVFPEEGIWRLNAYLGNKLFSSFYVQVEPSAP